MISARSYFACVGWILFVTFSCGFALVGAYVFVVGAIAGGFTDPPLPDWARGPILAWMMDIPQSAATDYDPNSSDIESVSASQSQGSQSADQPASGAAVLGVVNPSSDSAAGQSLPRGTDGPNLGKGKKYAGLSTTPQIINYKQLWVGYTDSNAADPDGLPFKGEVKLWSSWYGKPPLGCTFHDKNYASHTGQDFPVESGTPIYATMAGKVIWAARRGPWGNLVIIENGKYQTWFAHQEAFSVQPGDIVRAGDLLGWSDSTGNSTGPHLHYGVMWSPDGGITSYWIDPRNFFSPGSVTLWGCPK